MNSKTLSNLHRFGKVGKTIMTVLLVLSILVTAIFVVETIYFSLLPKDALTVRVTDHAEFRIGEENFDSLWEILSGGRYSYAGDASPEEMLGDNGSAVIPPENQEFQTNLSFFDQSYTSAKIYSDGSTKVIEAVSAPAEYRSASLAPVLAFLTLLCASAVASLFLLRRLFAVLTTSETPFCDELVKKLKAFGFSLLPIALFGTIAITLFSAFLTAGKNSGLQIQWGVLLAFAVTMCMVTVFRYGVQLQKESDETL